MRIFRAFLVALAFMVFGAGAFATRVTLTGAGSAGAPPLNCTLLNGNGSDGPGTIIANTDGSPVRTTTAFTNTTNTALTSGPAQTGTTSVTMYIGMDYGAGVSKIPCKFVIYNSSTPANWSTGGTSGTVDLDWRGYADGSGGPSSTAATACSGGTSISAIGSISGAEGASNHTSTPIAQGSGYRYIILCVTNSNVQSGQLEYSAQQFWDYQ